MSEQAAIAFLSEGTRTGNLATAGPSADPHVAPIWFIIDGRDLVFNTDRDSVKGRHLRANPRAALTVDVEQFPYAFVAVRGPVSLEEDPPDPVGWSTRIAERYVPAGQAQRYGQVNGAAGSMLCRLRMDRVVGVDDIALI